MRYTFDIWHTHAHDRPFQAHQMFDPSDLDLDLRVYVKVSKFALKFLELYISPIPIEVHLWYLAHTCPWTRPFNTHQMFDPSDLDLDFRVYVKVSKFALKFLKLYISPIPIKVHLWYLAHTCPWTRHFNTHQNFDPSDLDLRVYVKVSKFALKFLKLFISPIPIELHLWYLAHTCPWTWPL